MGIAFPGGRTRRRPAQTALLPLKDSPCPSCAALLDQLDGAAEHVSQQLNHGPLDFPLK